MISWKFILSAIGVTLVLGVLFYHQLPRPVLPFSTIGGKFENPRSDVIEENDDSVLEASDEPNADVIQSPEDDVIQSPEDDVIQSPEDDVIQSPEDDVILITNGTRFRANIPWFNGNTDFSCPNLPSNVKCRFSASPDELESSDAVVFRSREIRPDRMTLPKSRPSGQKWVVYETEAPTKTWDRIEADMDIWKEFNLTSTFTTDSDVPMALYQIVCKYDVTKACAGPKCKDYAKPKKIPGKAAWIVSHCRCPSQREKYVKELKKFFPVDIYGGCGTALCGDMEHNFAMQECTMKHLSENYKFYLSLENSVCDNYYTEKFTRFLSIDIVEVVLGNVDYTKFLPAGSFLDVRDFPSPKDLAEKLRYLDGNDTAFNQYISKKFTSRCDGDESIKGKTYVCRLCEHIHTHRNDIEIAPDFRHFWGLDKRCVSPQDFYASTAPEILPSL